MSLQNWREKCPVISHWAVMCQWLTKTSWSTRWRYGSTLVAGYLIIVYCWILLVRSHSCKVKPSKSKAYQQVSPGCKPEELWICWPFFTTFPLVNPPFQEYRTHSFYFSLVPCKICKSIFFGPGIHQLLWRCAQGAASIRPQVWTAWRCRNSLQTSLL